MKRKFLRLVSAAAMTGVAACALASCGSNNADEIKLGLIANLSGSASFYGNQVKCGAELAVKDINAAGGINGKQVVLDIKDDTQDTTMAVTQYNALVDDGVVGIVGAVISSTSEAVAAQAGKDNFPVITPSGSAASITKDRDSVFRACFTDPDQGVTLAKLCKDKGIDKVVLMEDTTQNYSTGIADTFTANASAYDVTIASTIKYNGLSALTTNLATYYSNVCAISDVDAIVFPDYTNADYQIVNQFRSGTTYKDITFIGGDGWDGTEAVENADAKKLYNCFYSTNLYTDSTDAKVVKFVADFKAAYPDESTVSQFAAMAYDAVYYFKGAIEAADSTKASDIISALHNLSFDGVAGKGTFDANGNPQKTASIVTWDETGKLSFYKTI